MLPTKDKFCINYCMHVVWKSVIIVKETNIVKNVLRCYTSVPMNQAIQ